jgi:hypothetical protein
MIRFVVAVVGVLGFVGSVLAQGMVLVPKVPVYKNGEYAMGTVVGPDGRRFSMYQYAEVRGADTYIHSVLSDQSGQEVSRSRTNFHTMEGEDSVGGAVTKVLRSTCSSATAYPLVLHKKYECIEERESHEERYTTKVTSQFDTVLPGNAGYCGKMDTEDKHAYMHIEACITQDGKWMLHSRIVAYNEKT